MSERHTAIPNFIGVDAGQQLRESANNALGGSAPITPMIRGGTVSHVTVAGVNISEAVAAATVTNAALRTIAARATDRINFADYKGADPTGRTDNSALIAQALSDARSQKKSLWFPSGTWGYANPTIIRQGDVVIGDGPSSQFLYIGETTSNGNSVLFTTPVIVNAVSPPLSGEPTVFTNFRVTGPWNGTTVTTQVPTPLIQVHGLWAVEFRDLIGEQSCNVGFMASFCWSVKFINCRMERCARDALNASASSFIQAVLNQIHHCDDNAISAHTLTGESWSLVSNVLIALNTISDTPGISCQGARRIVIADNVIERPRQIGIEVAFVGANPAEGESPPLAVRITGNVITDVINRQDIDGLDTESNYIAIGTLPPQAGSEPAIPGDPSEPSGVFVLPYPYFGVERSSGTDTTTPIPAAWHIEVSGNTCMRTLDPGSSGLLYSSIGYGEMFTRNGWLNPTLNGTALLQGIGVLTFSFQNQSTQIQHLAISGNKFHGMESAIVFGEGMQVTGGQVVDNDCIDFSVAAVVFPNPSLAMGVRLADNSMDGDPFLQRRGSGATNGRWVNGVNLPAAVAPNGCTGIIYENNLHRNVYQIAYGGFPVESLVRNNIIFCNPAGTGYNSSNEGVAVVPTASIGYTHVVEGSDPTLSTFGTMLNSSVLFATAQPMSGTFVEGQIVYNDAPVVGSGKVLLGWMRLTTGSGNVSGADWAPMYTTTS